MRKRKGQAQVNCSSIGDMGNDFFGSAFKGLVSGRHYKSNSKSWVMRQIDFYQNVIDPDLKRRLGVKHICRHQPTCSEYTKLAIKRHGTIKGIIVGARRVINCGKN